MTVGFIGLGNMGNPMCNRLLDAGHQVVVHDIDADAVKPMADRQARVMGSPKEVADTAEVVFASLPSNASHQAVALGNDGIHAGSKAKVFVNLCTVGGAQIQDVADELAKSNIATIDSPISGGPPGAAAGTLSVIVSGPTAAFEQVKGLLEQLGTITYAGEKVGMAQSLKLANNILSATALAATSEALVMGVKAGLDPEVMLQAINLGSGRNSATMDKIPSDVLTHDFAFGAAMDILLKDVDMAVAEGEGLGVPMQVCQSTRQFFRLARAQLGGETDITRVAEWVAEAAETKIPKTR
jgi:3-hydroxyisobutyrate dehydrogenase-like beta-hydroxyacid dehydrogenase